jgi:hypothetical protein
VWKYPSRPLSVRETCDKRHESVITCVDDQRSPRFVKDETPVRIHPHPTPVRIGTMPMPMPMPMPCSSLVPRLTFSDTQHAGRVVHREHDFVCVSYYKSLYSGSEYSGLGSFVTSTGVRSVRSLDTLTFKRFQRRGREAIHQRIATIAFACTVEQDLAFKGAGACASNLKSR